MRIFPVAKRGAREHWAPHLVTVGLNFKAEEDLPALVEEIVNLSKWGVAPYVVEGRDAHGQEFFFPLREGLVEDADEVSAFLRDCHLAFPVSLSSVRGTGAIAD